MSDAIIKLHDFGVAYDQKTVLSGVNTTIRSGRITAIIGPSGCGKSTMLKAMNRMLETQKDAAVFVVPKAKYPLAKALYQFAPICLICGYMMNMLGERAGRGCEGPWVIAKGAACVRQSQLVQID